MLLIWVWRWGSDGHWRRWVAVRGLSLVGVLVSERIALHVHLSLDVLLLLLPLVGVAAAAVERHSRPLVHDEIAVGTAAHLGRWRGQLLLLLIHRRTRRQRRQRRRRLLLLLLRIVRRQRRSVFCCCC